MAKEIKSFRKYLQQLGYSKSSCAMLPECVDEFLRYHKGLAPQSITQKHIESFYAWLHIRPNKRLEGGLSESYIYHHMYALKCFFAYLETTGGISHNPISTMKFKRPGNNSREPLTTTQVNTLFEAACSLKEQALLHLFYSCGLRRSEVVALNIRDVHFKSCLLYVRQGKGAKRRVVPMTLRVSKELESYYLKVRTDSSKKADDMEAFMLNTIGKRMSGSTCNSIIKSMAKKAGIESPCTLHHLRHSIATHLLESGLSIENVRDFLGHSYLEATQIYVKINKQQLKNL
jgi:integrase/recombinase XerD